MPEKISSHTGEAGAYKPELIREIDPLLKETIYNEKEKEVRHENFEKAWQERWHGKLAKALGKEGYFQTETHESPFSQYSSRGWKIHVAFERGKEEEMARFLYENGLYFKLEAGIGTYFDGRKESGATIYIGSNGNMKVIADAINQNVGGLLTGGATAEVRDKKVAIGSGSDIEILPKIMARFDVAKTQYGWAKGNKKYAEHGVASWLSPALGVQNYSGLPILKKYEEEVSKIDQQVLSGKLTKDQIPRLKVFLFEVYKDSKQELVKDFGEEFVLGTKQ